MKKNKNSKRGRPSKYKPEFVEQAKKLCLLGAIDKDLADFFNVTEDCITRWKKKYPEFFLTIKKAKAEMDAKVVRSLFQRATGYEHTDTHFASYEGDIISEEYIKHYPPDPTSMIFWLKIRQPENWRDKHEVKHDVSDDLKTVMDLINDKTKGKLPANDTKDSSRAS